MKIRFILVKLSLYGSDDVKNAAYEVINRKGATAFSVAAVLTRIVEAFLRDEKIIVSSSCPSNGCNWCKCSDKSGK